MPVRYRAQIDRVARFGGLRRRRALVPVVALALLIAACVPAPSAPELPADVGVTWFRDTGTAPPSDPYALAMERYSKLGGVTDGPVALTPQEFFSELTLPPSGWIPGILPLLPDGTARFPWNGFAGEDFVVTRTFGEVTTYDMTFPGGSCRWAFNLARFDSMIPSPDGTKVALFYTDLDASVDRVSIVDTTDNCSTIVSVQNPDFLNVAAVWSPASDAILYTARWNPGEPEPIGRMVRLEAVPGASPVPILNDDPRTTTALGWASDGTILFSSQSEPVFGVGSSVSTLETMPIDGIGRTLIDRATFTTFQGQGGLVHPVFHYGYFVPGTTMVVYNDGSQAVTNGTGQTFPHFRVRLHDMETGAESSISDSGTPLAWHTDGGIEVPNAEIVGRFYR